MAGIISAATARLAAALWASTGAAMIGFIAAGVGAVRRSFQDKGRDHVHIHDYGGIGDGVKVNDGPLWDAIRSLRTNPTQIQTGIGGELITAYTSGTVELGVGAYAISPDQLEIWQDVGLTLKGQGSRRTNNAIRAATTLLIKGPSTGFGVKVRDSGARGVTFRDLDICYDDAGFTGDVADLFNAPGVTMERVFLGTFGTTGGERKQTARSCLRATYDEFLHLTDVVMDGAKIGVWFDNSRGPYEFGGSMTTLESCVFYDITDTMIKQDSTRSRRELKLNNVCFNPITMAGLRAIDVGNIQGFNVDGGMGIGSVGHAPSVEWIRATNVTGYIRGFNFGDYTKAATVAGWMDISNNIVDTTDGFNLLYGVVKGSGNRFRYGASGWIVSGPLTDLCVDLGPDYFAPALGKSYDIASSSGLINGRINYSREQDNSVNRWINVNENVAVANIDRKAFKVLSANYAINISNSGRTIDAAGTVEQTFTLPTPAHGTSITIAKSSMSGLYVNCPEDVKLYMGDGQPRRRINVAGDNVGALVELEAMGTTGWRVRSTVGAVVFIV